CCPGSPDHPRKGKEYAKTAPPEPAFCRSPPRPRRCSPHPVNGPPPAVPACGRCLDSSATLPFILASRQSPPSAARGGSLRASLLPGRPAGIKAADGAVGTVRRTFRRRLDGEVPLKGEAEVRGQTFPDRIQGPGPGLLVQRGADRVQDSRPPGQGLAPQALVAVLRGPLPGAARNIIGRPDGFLRGKTEPLLQGPKVQGKLQVNPRPDFLRPGRRSRFVVVDRVVPLVIHIDPVHLPPQPEGNPAVE